MKFSLLLCALLGYAASIPIQKNLDEDLNDFLALVPVDQIKEIVQAHLKNDEEFQEVVQYLKGEQWAVLVANVDGLEEVVEFKAFLKAAGLDVEKIIAFIHDLIANAQVGTKNAATTKGLKDVAEEIEEVLPTTDFMKLFNDKVTNDEDFKTMIEKIKSPEAYALVEKVRHMDEVQRLEHRLEEMGFDVEGLRHKLYALLGWESSRIRHDLDDDLNDFLALVPVDKIKEIVQAHLKNDKEFQEVVQYLKGEQWAALVANVDSLEEVVEFKAFLKAAGLDVEKIIAFIHDLIANAQVGTKNAATTKGLKDVAEEIEEVFPTTDFMKLFNDKVTNDEDFKTMIEKIKSPKAYALVEKVRHMDEVQRLENRLEEMGFDVEGLRHKLYALLGWESSRIRHDLDDDLNDFLALVPVDKIKEIVQAHLKKDEEFQEVVQYLKGEQWAALVANVDSLQEVVEFKAFLKAAGLDVEKIIAFIHDLIANAQVGTKNAATTKGLKDVAEEIEEVFPTTDFMKLFNDKVTNDEDFKTMIEKIKSPEAYALIEKVRHMDEVQRLENRLEEMGFDVEGLRHKLYALLGWESSRIRHDLDDDLNDFLALVPVDKIKEIVQAHLKNDEEFQEVVQYLKGEQWAALVANVDGLEEVVEFKAFLKAAGLDVEKIIAFIHDLIANAQVGESKPVLTRGLKDVVEEVEEIFPTTDFVKLFNEKVTNDEDFKELVEKVKSTEAHALAEKVRYMEEVQRLEGRLTEMGFDVDGIREKIYTILGWN